MDFNLVKKNNKKINLWSGVIYFSVLVVCLIIIFALSGVNIKTRTIVAIQLVINNLLIWLLIVAINASKVLIALIFKTVYYRHPKTRLIEKIEFVFNPWVHFYIVFLAIIIWLIEISGFMFQTQDWVLAFKNYWWVCFIMFSLNVIFCYTSFLMEKYLYNQTPEISEPLKKNN